MTNPPELHLIRIQACHYFVLVIIIIIKFKYLFL